MSPLHFQIFKYLFAVTTVAFVCFEFNTFRTKSWYIRAIILMALCYPVGKTIEFWVIGPEFLRGHLSDFGFVPCFSYFLTRERHAIPILRDMTTWRTWQVTARWSLGIAVFVEVIELIGQHLEIAKHTPTRGDPIDMACYFLSFWLLMSLARRQVAAYEVAHAEVVEYQEGQARNELEEKRAARQERRRGQPRRKGRQHTRGPTAKKR